VLVRLFGSACRHNGCGDSDYGNRTGDGSLCELDYDELFACVEDCWERVHPGPWLRPIHSHECSSGCPMIVHRDTYVCAVSNTVHHCTQYTCEYAMEFEHERVCPITANVYPPHYKFSFEQIGHLDEQRKRDTRVTTGAAGPKRDHLAVHHHTAAAAAGPASAASVRRAASAAAIPEEDTLHRVEAFVGRFLDPSKPPLDRELRHATAVRILDLWRTLKALPGLELPSNYSLQAHVFTIMWASSKNALTIGADTFYPFEKELVGRMRDISECVVGELRCPFNAHTKFTSAVNTAMRMWYMQRQQAERNRLEAIRMSQPCIGVAKKKTKTN
jgi:hypothetical protein